MFYNYDKLLFLVFCFWKPISHSLTVIKWNSERPVSEIVLKNWVYL